LKFWEQKYGNIFQIFQRNKCIKVPIIFIEFLDLFCRIFMDVLLYFFSLFHIYSLINTRYFHLNMSDWSILEISNIWIFLIFSSTHLPKFYISSFFLEDQTIEIPMEFLKLICKSIFSEYFFDSNISFLNIFLGYFCILKYC
jgi:hypothetical protein